MNPEIKQKFEQVAKAIRTHGQELASHPGVLAVQADFVVRAGEFTAEPAIVVLVSKKVAAEAIPEEELLAREIDGVPVDVQQASIEQQGELLRRKPGDQSALEFLDEQAAGTGVIDPRSPIEREKAAVGIEAERVDYPKPGFELTLVEAEMSVTAHASPDNGWAELKKFLEGPVEHLSATIYEFEAKYIKDALINACGDTGTMDFVMHYMAKPSKWDGKDAALALKEALGDRLTFAWAPVVMTSATTEGWFPSSYHEKMIIKDHRYIWISSGNWKSSGQPKEDPFNPPNDFDEVAFLRGHNREWHVILDSPELAEQFERYIKHDLDTASAVQNPDVQLEGEMPDVFVMEDVAAPETEIEWFTPEIIESEQLRVMPLLSPDNFIEEITNLVKTASSRLYIINQYLKPTDIEQWRELNEFVSDFSNRNGVDFKLILRDINYQQSISMMTEFGFDLSNLRILKGCHTKGIIVDDRAVVVGSHNWSGQGFMENRDASLIFEDARVIKHYETLFNFDYARAKRPRRAEPESEALIARADESTPAGMRRIDWASYTED